MCGIVAYIGDKEAYPLLIKGLKRLEYRGYDSAGVALMNGTVNIYKKKGKVQELVNHALIERDTRPITNNPDREAIVGHFITEKGRKLLEGEEV